MYYKHEPDIKTHYFSTVFKRLPYEGKRLDKKSKNIEMIDFLVGLEKFYHVSKKYIMSASGI